MDSMYNFASRHQSPSRSLAILAKSKGVANFRSQRARIPRTLAANCVTTMLMQQWNLRTLAESLPEEDSGVVNTKGL
jgi:hypothetical protein